MKKYLSRFVLVLLSALCLVAQAEDISIYENAGADVCSANPGSHRYVFIVDNSGSMDSSEFLQSKSTIDAVINLVFASGLEGVEVAVVQYGTNHYDQEHKYDVTVPFTDDLAVALSWTRAYGPGSSRYWDLEDHLPASLARMRTEGVWSNSGALALTDATNVQFVVFTDAWESWGPNDCCSNLVARGYNVANESNSGTISTGLGFTEYNRLKNGSVLMNDEGVALSAQFTVLNTNTNSSAQSAAAAIASPGGDWNGAVAANSGDPEGSQTKPRRYIQGSFSPADTTLLVDLVTQVIAETKAVTYTQVAPAVAVNAFNRLTHSDKIYYSIFEPQLQPRWNGNVKKFRLAVSGTVVDEEGDSAIEANSGAIKDSALSFWSGGNYPECADLPGCTTTKDGREVIVGGFREQTTNVRTIYSDNSALEATDPSYAASGTLQLSATTNIDSNLIGASSSVTYIDFVETPFSVINGESLSVSASGNNNNLIFEDSTATYDWTSRAITGKFSELGANLAEPYEVEFTFETGTAFFYVALMDNAVQPSNPAGAGARENMDYGLYFDVYGTVSLRDSGNWRTFNNGSTELLFLAGDRFKFVVDGTTIKTYQNDVLIKTSNNTITAEQDMYVEVTAYEDAAWYNDEFALVDFQINQAEIQAINSGGTSREDILKWMLGVDVFNHDGDSSATDEHSFVADGLHSQPNLVNFGGTQSAPQSVLFHSTNVGALHAIDAETGVEKWAYYPREHLGNPIEYIENDAATVGHVYGLDAPMKLDVDSSVINGVVKVSSAYMYLGERRGGNSYYGLNVTNASGEALAQNATTCPVATDKLCRLFTIEGGVTNGFNALGQTWAKPVLGKLNTSCNSSGCTRQSVAVFPGGYDSQYDDPSLPVSSLAGSVLGNHLYIVDATTGALVWSAGKTNPGVQGDHFLKCNGTPGACSDTMQHSFVAEPVVADMDSDGAIDVIFALDIAGNVWRFDFRSSADDVSGRIDINQSSGGIIATLAEAGVDRRFFNKPDIVLLLERNGALNARFNIVVGSGYRAQPLLQESAGNRYYIVFDEYLRAPKYDDDGDATYKYALSEDSTEESEVYNTVSADLINEVNEDNPIDQTSAHRHGFYVSLSAPAYEKVMAPTLTSNFKVYGISYTPATDPEVADCSLGESKLTIIDLVTGQLTSQQLASSGIPSPAIIVKLLDDNDTTGDASDDIIKEILCVGTECFGDLLGAGRTRVITRGSWWENNVAN